MSIKLGSATTVVISSSTMAKEVVQKHDRSFSSRMVSDALTTYDNHKSSMIWLLPVCPQWRNLRRLTTVHIFTAQKLNASQDLRQQKLKDLISHVHQNARIGCAVDIGHAAFTTVLNMISNICFSVDFDSASVSAFKAAVKGVFSEAVKPNISDCFPVLKFLDVQGIRRGMRNNVRILEEILDKITDEKLALLQSREGKKGMKSAGDLLDIILDPSHENEIELQRHEIKALLKDFFVAGTDTTTSTVEWVMAELFHNPSKMIKARRELSEMIGKDRHVEEEDIVRLPYLQAIVKETLRLHPPAPLLVPHKAAADVKIHDFVVPKDAQVLVNAWAIGRDPSIWKDPVCFNPERFLDLEVDYKGQDFELIPFGSGRRICPGLPLAHRMVHLMVGSLVHSFDWKLENGLKLEELDMEEEFGFTLMKANALRAIPVSLK